MNPDVLLICSIILICAGLFSMRVSWASLTFQKNEKNEYDFKDLALYGGRFCAFKNFIRGLAGTVTGKHLALRTPSLHMLVGLLITLAGVYLLLV